MRQSPSSPQDRPRVRSARPLRDEGEFVRIAKGCIEGAFAWRHDPLFRPLIGVYSGDNLKFLVPSFRRPSADGEAWLCHFSAELPDDLPDDSALSVACLETGDVLQPAAPARHSARRTHRVMLDDILSVGQRRAGGFEYGGFRAFLSLSLADQIAIFYSDYLDRVPEPDAIELYRERISAGEISILGMRDEIATGEEFAEASSGISIHERRGRWCLWSGLRDVAPHLLPAPLAGQGGEAFSLAAADPESPLRSSFEEIAAPSDVAGILASIAIGPTGDVALYARWVRAHDALAAEIAADVRESARNRRSASARTVRRYTLYGMLASMTPGGAGMKLSDGSVGSRPGVAGYVLYGPYLHLAPGRHMLLCHLRAESPSAAPAHLAIEAVYESVLLAREDLRLTGTVDRTFRLTFTVPGGDSAVLEDEKFEFRVWTDGMADIAIDELNLEIAVDGNTTIAAPSVTDWLSFLQPGSAGKRNDDGSIAALPSAGHVFYGPYYRLLPGNYQLAVACENGPIGGPQLVVLEVVTAEGVFLAQQQFHLGASHNRFELAFGVPDAGAAEDLAGPLEFRLGKGGGGEFRCVKIDLVLAG